MSPLHFLDNDYLSWDKAHKWGSTCGASDKESACHCRRCKRLRFNLWVRKIPRRRAWQPTPVFLPREQPGGQQSMRSHRVGHD